MSNLLNNKPTNNHIAITSCEDIHAIMSPVLTKHGMTVFNYYRTYFDGSILRLSTDRAWTEHYFLQNYHHKNTVPSSYIEKPLNYYLWLTEDCPEILLDAAMNFNTSNGISIARRHQTYIEFFCFATTVNNKAIINNFYLNNFDLLLHYTNYFTDKASDILLTAENDKLIVANQTSSIKKNSMLTKQLSARELECTSLLLRGMSHKEIGNNLNLSPRTIESYLNNAKNKLQCNTQKQLILKLIAAYDFN